MRNELVDWQPNTLPPPKPSSREPVEQLKRYSAQLMRSGAKSRERKRQQQPKNDPEEQLRELERSRSKMQRNDFARRKSSSRNRSDGKWKNCGRKREY